MPRDIWKLGKFNKGINSHTDPKDISTEEWAELEDMSVSRVGKAETMGSPISDTSILPYIVDNLIPGRGLYRFNSDNTYMSLSGISSYSLLELTGSATDGGYTYGTFSIKNLIWLFNTKPSSVQLTFQLTVGGNAVMDAMTVIGNGAGNSYDSIPQKPVGNPSDSDGKGGATEPGTNKFHYLWNRDADSISDLYNGTAEGGNYASWASIPHDMFSGDWNSVCTDHGGGDADNHTGVNHIVQSGNGASSMPWKFWDENYNYYTYDDMTNVNNVNLLYSATYSNNYPNGSLDWTGHYMLGFYKWDGYKEGVIDENGVMLEGYIREFSAFSAPQTQFYSPQTPVDHNHSKMRMAFQSNLILAINAYTGGTSAQQFKACFVGSECYETTPDVLADWVAANPHKTDIVDDHIYIKSRIVGAFSGVISATVACPAGSNSGNFISSGVTLLSDIDTYGKNYGDGSAVDYNVSELTDYAVSGKPMVLTGDTMIQSNGTGAGGYTTYKLTVRGNPNSGDTVKLSFLHGGTEQEDETEITANYSTNQEFATAIGAAADALSLYAVGTVALVPGTQDSIPPYSVEIKSASTGQSHFFIMEVLWTTQYGYDASYSGVSDEQVVILSRDNYIVETLGDTEIFRVNCSIWSSESSTWINQFKNRALQLNDTDYKRSLNWFYISGNDIDPLFYDEGNTLRIVESNFELLDRLRDAFTEYNIEENDGYATSILEPNPGQWISYLDISGYFGDAFNLTGDAIGFFIGKINKVWRFTRREVDGTIPASDLGLLKTNNAVLTSAGVVPEPNQALMQVYTQTYTGGSAGIDWIGTIKIYAVACYSDGSESLPGHKFTTDLTFGATAGIEDGDTFKMQVLFRPSNNIGDKCFNDMRIDGIRLYYTHDDENHATFWNLGKFDFRRGFIKAITAPDTIDDVSGNEPPFEWKDASSGGVGLNTNATTGATITMHNGTTTEIEYLEMPKTESFEDINAFSPEATSININYKTACIAGRRTFAGNIRRWNGSNYEYYNDRMVVSPINALDTFPYPDNILDLDISDGDEIVALAAYGDKVIQFKKKVIYILNISTGIAAEFFIEERHRWKGILNKNHFCTTDDGIFWVNERGAWIYDGDEVKDLIIQGEDSDSQRILSEDDWSSFITSETLVGYNALSREVLIVKKHTHASLSDGDCFIYSLIVNSWVIGKHRFFYETDKSMTNMISLGTLGKLAYFIEQEPDSVESEQDIH